MPTVPRETLSMQDPVCGDYNRTPVKFRVPDIYLFVGEYQNKVKSKSSIFLRQHFPCTDPGRFSKRFNEPVSAVAVSDFQSSA